LPCFSFQDPSASAGEAEAVVELIEDTHYSLRIGTASFTTNYTNGTNVTNNNTMLLVLRIEQKATANLDSFFTAAPLSSASPAMKIGFAFAFTVSLLRPKP